MVLDASSVKSKDIQPGHHICEGSVVTKEESQPLSLYSKIYSTKSDGFRSMNDEQLECIESIKGFLKRKCTFVMDRGFDEEGFRFKKTEYGFEQMLLRKLHSMNVLNTLLMIHLGHISALADKVNKKLLVIKIVERSKSLRMDNSLWFYKIKSGIKEILKFSQKGIKEHMQIRSKGKYKQLQLSI